MAEKKTEGTGDTKGTGKTRRGGGRGGRAGRQGEGSRSISVKLYQGMPNVEITENVEITMEGATKGEGAVRLTGEDKLSVRLDVSETLAAKLAERGPITISLESLNVDLLSNQSFGMVEASTGCISNPGGPSC